MMTLMTLIYRARHCSYIPTLICIYFLKDPSTLLICQKILTQIQKKTIQGVCMIIPLGAKLKLHIILGLELLSQICKPMPCGFVWLKIGASKQATHSNSSDSHKLELSKEEQDEEM